MRKIFMMEDMTVYKENENYKLEIDKNRILTENEKDFEGIQEESPYFFNLEEAKLENQKYYFSYIIEDNYKPITELKHYSYLFRLSILKKILEISNEIIDQRGLLHPHNIFFNTEDLKSIKLMYRSDKWLPEINSLSLLTQYKLIIFSTLNKYSYEQFKIKKNVLLQKLKSDFIFYIDNSESIDSLYDLINKKLYSDESKHFLDIEQHEKKIKKLKIRLVGVAIASIIFVTISALVINKLSINKATIAYSKSLDNAHKKTLAYKEISEGNKKGGISTLEDLDASDNEIANVYFYSGDYEQAIKMDKSHEKKVVDLLYKKNDSKKILDLKDSSNYIDTEKKIINYDYAYLLSQKAFVTDKGQLKRMGMAFVQHNNVSDAVDVNNRLKDKDLANAIKKAQGSH